METQFLKELIENNARVILPEFGAFLVKDDGTGVFKPQNVTFSPFLRYNDGMVEEKLATKLKVGKDQARAKLESFIEMMKDELQSKKVFIIQGLGSLQIDGRGSIQFSTSQSVTAPLKPTPKVEEAKPKETKQKPDAPKAETPKEEKPKEEQAKQPEPPIEKATEQIIAEQPKEMANEPEPKAKIETIIPPKPQEKAKPVTPKQQKPAQSKPTPKSKQSSSGGGAGKAILFGTLIGIGFVVVAASGWYLYSKGVFSSSREKGVTQKVERVATQPTKEQKAEPEKGKFEDEFEKLSAEMDQSTDVVSTEQTSKPAEKKISKSHQSAEPAISIPVTQEGMFHIVAGSFRNADYAEKFSRDMQSSGYNSRVLAQPTGMHAVTLGSFLTRQQAVDSMNVWKQKNPNIWILNQ